MQDHACKRRLMQNLCFAAVNAAIETACTLKLHVQPLLCPFDGLELLAKLRLELVTSQSYEHSQDPKNIIVLIGNVAVSFRTCVDGCCL